MEVLILTGACGVGKSTVARGWAKAKAGAVIECDYFTEWIYQPSFPRWTSEEEEFVASLAIATAQEYLKRRMPVVTENVWSPVGIQLLVDGMKPHERVASLKVVWLQCILEENHRRDQLRVPENQMKDRVEIVNVELQSYSWPKYVRKIDSTELSVEETVCEIDRCDPISHFKKGRYDD